MDLNEYQDAASVYAFAIKDPMDAIAEATFGLAEEAGEVSGKMKRVFRGDSNLDELSFEIKKELGDCLWYISQLALRLGYDLEQVAAENLAKLQDRKERNALRGTGDKR
jgi:NTP pyrophosphatase (non-canonical NTP hydrolase)